MSAKLMLCISMIIFGTIGLFTRSIAVTSGELALYRAVMAAVLLVGYFLVTKQKMDFTAIKKELGLLLLSGVAMGINWILLFEAYKHTTISVATLSYYFAPVLVMILCPILFRERLSGKQILCFVMSTVGLVLIVLFEGGDAGAESTVAVDASQVVGELAASGGTEIVGELAASFDGGHLLGVLFGLGAAVFYATVILLNKCIKNVAGIQRTFLQFLSAIAILLPYVALTGGMNLSGLDGVGWICLLVVGIVHTGITYCMYFSSLKELKGQEVSILSYLDPLVAVLVSVGILGEQMSLMQLLGGVLILGFTLWNELGNQST
ncbi:MAG: EamA family transporter [Lachnospiraceae bacterium]|nr:EamA family transporter [Lachnospiraceae bacterium]